jgi:hypothetical protein
VKIEDRASHPLRAQAPRGKRQHSGRESTTRTCTPRRRPRVAVVTPSRWLTAHPPEVPPTTTTCPRRPRTRPPTRAQAPRRPAAGAGGRSGFPRGSGDRAGREAARALVARAAPPHAQAACLKLRRAESPPAKFAQTQRAGESKENTDKNGLSKKMRATSGATRGPRARCRAPPPVGALTPRRRSRRPTPAAARRRGTTARRSRTASPPPARRGRRGATTARTRGCG